MEILFHDIRKLFIIPVIGFPNLEVNIRVLDCVPKCRMLRIESTVLVRLYVFRVHQLDDRINVGHLHLVDLMRGSKTIKEMHEGNVAFHCRQMCHRRQIDDLLHTGGTVLCPSGIPAGHHVRMVAKNTHGMRPDRSCCDMQHSRLSFSRDPVEDRDHQHQSLRGGIAGGQSAGLDRSVYRADRSGFRLHFRQRHRLTKHILSSSRGPFVRQGCHRRRRRDRVNRRDLRKRIRHVSGSFVAVHRHKLFHFLFLFTCISHVFSVIVYRLFDFLQIPCFSAARIRSSRKSGCAMEIISSALSQVFRPRRSTLPCSVTM